MSSQLLEQGIVERITFVEPADWAPVEIGQPEVGITTVRPRLKIPKRAGGLRLLGSSLRRGALRDIDLLWINDAPLGRWVVRPGQRAFYDVTDDWRESKIHDRVGRRLVAAENWLSARVPTVVCSNELAGRWKQRYGTNPAVVHNGVDIGHWQDVVPFTLTGAGPHLGYVGTLHAERLDVDLVIELAQSPAVGTVHLIGPDVLDPSSRARLDAAGVRRMGPVAHTEVPAWMRSFDVLICPHVVTAFTLSLDAIKAYEYAAAGRPVVATPTSGFQGMDTPDGMVVADRPSFVASTVALLRTGDQPQHCIAPVGWDERARDLGEVLRTLASSTAHR